MSGMLLTAGERPAIPMWNSCGTNSSGHHFMSGMILTAGESLVIPMWISYGANSSGHHYVWYDINSTRKTSYSHVEQLRDEFFRASLYVWYGIDSRRKTSYSNVE